MLNTTIVTDAEKYRVRLSEMMNVYLKRGGKITKIPTGVSKYDPGVYKSKALTSALLHEEFTREKKRSWIRKQWGYKGIAR